MSCLDQLRQMAQTKDHRLQFLRADFSEQDLSGITLEFVDLTRACFANANLREARLQHVILAGADFRGCNLERAEIRFAEAPEVDLSQARATGMVWTQSHLLSAKLAGADLSRARFQGCNLESTSFVGTDLTKSRIIDSVCHDAQFQEATMTKIEAFGTSFLRANFTGAKDFFACREIVTELLRRETKDNIEDLQLIGAGLLKTDWCYAEWHRYLSSDHYRSYFRRAIQIMKKYPQSGFEQALEAGLDWRSAVGEEP